MTVLACKYCGLKEGATRNIWAGIEGMLAMSRCPINGKHIWIEMTEEVWNELKDFILDNIDRIKREERKRSFGVREADPYKIKSEIKRLINKNYAFQRIKEELI